MDDMIFLIAGYAVFLIVALVFVLSVVSRQRKLQQELEVLEQLIEDGK